eukprot:GGOE01004670.1.p3 GENE.GGOE01004670.1~~GGOE01004670.1.p3  ORF type:complete len:109 (-),score=8.58 GGOE01004670.1:143-469(-)
MEYPVLPFLHSIHSFPSPSTRFPLGTHCTTTYLLHMTGFTTLWFWGTVMYNSSHDPNVRLERLVSGLFRYVALRRVASGEELLINYGEHWWNDPAHQHLKYKGPLRST